MFTIAVVIGFIIIVLALFSGGRDDPYYRGYRHPYDPMRSPYHFPYHFPYSHPDEYYYLNERVNRLYGAVLFAAILALIAVFLVIFGS